MSSPAPHLSWLEHVPDPCMVVDVHDQVIAANAAMAAFAGADLVGRPLHTLLADVRPASGCAVRWRTTAYRANGVPLCVEPAQRVGDDGTRAITCRVVETLTAPEGSAAMLDEAFTRAPIGMAFFNTDGQYVRVNAAICALLGRTEDQLLGRRDQEFTHPDDRQSDVDAAWRILNGELDTWQTEKRFLRPDMSVVWAIANLTFLRDDGGRPLAWLGQFQDITERRALEDRFRLLADEDPLTGLPNRRRLEQELQRTLAGSIRQGTRGALLILDLDGFKAVNDQYGHARGDAVLGAVAERLRRRVRDADLLARLGGDEFAVLLDGCRRADAERVAADLREAVAAGGDLGVSIGIATFGPEALDTPAGLLDRADQAMYRAKLAVRRR